MLMTMLVMLALTLMLLLDALKTSAYAGADNANVDTKMPSCWCIAMLLMLPLLPLLGQVMLVMM